MATFSPGATSKLTSRSTQSGSPASSTPYANQTPSNRMPPLAPAPTLRPGSRDAVAARSAPASTFSISIGSSSSLKTRSDEAIAACNRLYFSDRSWIGRKNRRAYCRNAVITPTVIAPSNERSPPYQMMRARASAVKNWMTGKKSA